MRKKKFLSVLLTLAMTLSVLSPTVYAAEPESTEQNVQTTENPQQNEIPENEISENEIPENEIPENEIPENESISENEDLSLDEAEGQEEQTGDDETEAPADDGSAERQTDVLTEDESTDEEQIDAQTEDSEDEEGETTVSPAADYATFLTALKSLESYATDYAATQSDGTTALGLVLNYLRCGNGYNDSNWKTLAGAENTGFTSYVATQDAEKNTSAQATRGIGQYTTPDGLTVEFAHMFATMGLANYNSTNADFGGWAGDLVDLMSYTKGKLTSTSVEDMAREIRTTYLLVDDDNDNVHSFGILDMRGDLDAYCLTKKLAADSQATLSSVMEAYFTASLTDEARAVYFLQNRFGGSVIQEAVRNSVLNAYQADNGCSVLEADRELTNESDLRTACCYAFADYLYGLAGGSLTNDYYTVFSSSSSTLAPGITQDIKYALTTDDKQIVYYIATADVSRDDVSIYANYKDNDPSKGWGMQRVTDQIAAAIENHSDSTSNSYIENYTPVVGVNADFYNMSNGAPQGALVMEGREYHAATRNFFAILKDGTAMIGGSDDYYTYKDQIQEAVGGSIYLVKDGEVAVSSSADYYNSRASRTCVGITAEGKVVLMVLDGRQEPFSVGGSAQEIAQIMKDAGCVTAINLDGGGSTTYAAKQEGADEVTVVNRPSDGYERSVSSSLMVVSTAQPSDTFDHAIVSTDTDYLTVGAELSVTAAGVNISGGSAELPEGATLTVSDESVATLSDGVLTGVAIGDVTVSLVLGEETLGSKTLHVITVPDGLTFTKDSINAVYGSQVALPLEASYNGNPVTIAASDITFGLSTSGAGTFDGLTFIGNEDSGVRQLTITASLSKDLSISDSMLVALYKNGEAVFDFETATSGDEQLAWNRVVSNSSTEDEVTYHVSDPSQTMDVSYVLAHDMTTVPIPEKLTPLLSMVAGGDVSNVRAWDLLLQLAERVGELTTVTVKLQFDENLDVDASDITLVNDYFMLTSSNFDETSHTLTVVCNWIKQTAAIDNDTANPICILSGIKVTPKSDAVWDENECLTIKGTGNLSYDIYLRSNALYSFASQETHQTQYSLYPYSDSEHLYNGAAQQGGHFASTYKKFEDSFTLDKSSWSGWIASGDNLYYYKDNKALTGIQYVPGYEDEDNTYYYEFDENGVCQGKVTGLFELDGAKYYATNGKALSGWRLIQDEDGTDQYYYFDPETFQAVTGKQTIDGYSYEFENYKLIRGDFVTDAGGSHYRWAGEWMCNKWLELDGKKYYLGYGPNGYAQTGPFHIYEYATRYAADENGVWQESLTGLYTYEGDTYYVVNGIIQEYPGLVKIGNDYYYFRSNSKAVKGRSYWITVTNDLLPEAQYTFDSDGKMVNPPTVDPDPEEPEVKNGIVSEKDSLYYYVNGILTRAGLIQIDGSYYYVKTSSGEVVHGRSYWVTATNDLLPAGLYTFDEDGKMMNPPTVDPDPEEPEVKNGIVSENSSLYYYVNGTLTGAGLIQIDGSYYYVKTSTCEVVHGRSYWVTLTNDLLPAGQYTFADDGKMIDPPTMTFTEDSAN